MEQYQNLFELMEREHGKRLLQSELDDIATACAPIFETGIKKVEAENAHLRNILAIFVQCNKEAPKWMCDCMDNDGYYYQSALLSGALSLAERAIKPAEQSA